MSNERMNDVVLQQPLRELALFAGAGGGILCGHLLGWKCVCAVEFASYPREVLLARQRDGMLPPFPIWDDVRTFDGKPWRGHVDVVSGGFPCQDISVAGKGDGLDGERSGLWSEMARIIGEVQPRFAFVENSPMLTSRGLDRVLGDLSTLGYDAEWGVVGADDAGAPHRRERIWILAYTPSERPSGAVAEWSLGELREGKAANIGLREGVPDHQHPIGQLADPDVCGRLHGQAEVGSAEGGVHAQREPEPSGEDVADTDNEGCDYIRVQDRAHSSGCGNSTGQPYKGNSIGGSGDWWATEPGLGGAIDGLATGMVGHWGPGWEDGVPRVATGVPNRVDRLKAIGNGQVPAAAALAWNTLYQRIQR